MNSFLFFLESKIHCCFLDGVTCGVYEIRGELITFLRFHKISLFLIFNISCFTAARVLLLRTYLLRKEIIVPQLTERKVDGLLVLEAG